MKEGGGGNENTRLRHKVSLSDSEVMARELGEGVPTPTSIFECNNQGSRAKIGYIYLVMRSENISEMKGPFYTKTTMLHLNNPKV